MLRFMTKAILALAKVKFRIIRSPRLMITHPIPQAELAKLTPHESNIHQLINVAKNLVKDSPELEVLVQEPMFRLEVEWKRLYNLMQCCNTQLKIYEENLPFYRILNQITKNTSDIDELIIHPNTVNWGILGR